MYIDIFLGIFLFIGLVQGYHRGIIRTLFAFLGFIAGILAAMKFSPFVVGLFDRIFNWDPVISLVLGVGLTFVLIMWGIRWLGRGLEKSLKAVRLNFLNKALGAVLFMGIMTLAFAGVTWFLNEVDILPDEQKESSISYPYLEKIPDHASDVFESVKPVFRDFWEKLEAVVEESD